MIQTLEGYDSIALDISIDQVFNITEEFMSFNINGTLTPASNLTDRPDLDVPDIPLRNDDANTSLQVFLSNYFLDTLASSIL